jgi:hypothetical protein
MLHGEVGAALSEKQLKPINAYCGQNVEILNVKFIIIIIINRKWVCTRWQWYCNTQYNTIHKITNAMHKRKQEYKAI